MLPAQPPNSRRICSVRNDTFSMCSLSGRMWFRNWSANTMMVSKAMEPQISALPGFNLECFMRLTRRPRCAAASLPVPR